MDNIKINVLIFPAGAENALEIYDSLRYNVNLQVYGASGKKDFAEYKYPEEYYIEDALYITDSHFDELFQSILTKYKINIVIPTHDEVALYLAKKRGKFSSKILVADYETAKICREKRLMYELVKDESFCPHVYALKNICSENFPVFIKPNKGEGGVNARKIKKIQELPDDNNDYVITEYLSGEEASVDCFTDKYGSLVFCGARSRERIQMGIAFRSTTMEMTEEIRYIAETLNSRLHFFGAWYFQVKKNHAGRYKLLEFSCRQAGTMTLYRHMGINFPLLGIFELLGKNTSYVMNSGECQIERCLFTQFKYHCVYQKVYIDFDDTIVVDNHVCDVIIRFIYQCINRKIKLILLTRHEGDLLKAMKYHRLSELLFDEIYHIGFGNKKTEFIQPENAIFIDNSFQERKEVSDMFGIPVFDVNMVDMLLEY